MNGTANPDPPSTETGAETRLRSLVVAGTGKPPEAELKRLMAADLMPDAFSAENAINADFVDDRSIGELGGLYGRFLRRLPFVLAATIETLRRARRYDVVVTWSEIPSILVAALMRVIPGRPAQVAIVFWPSKPKKAIPLWLVQRGVERFIVGAPLQRRFMQERLRIAPERLIASQLKVDTRFWRPMDGASDLICAVGQEMRDYATLVEALRPLEVPCHIAAGTHAFNTLDESWWRQSLSSGELPANLTVGPKSFTELRALYARARFVVVPLRPSDNDNGITTILEAMAMGRAVIATESPGQVGVLEDGVNCVRVPPSDPVALREAILSLWDDPERCARLGAAGRELVARTEGIERWTEVLVRAAEEAVAARRSNRPG